MVSGKVSVDNPTYPQRVGMPRIPSGSVCAVFTVVCCGSNVVAASDVAVLLLLLFQQRAAPGFVTQYRRVDLQTPTDSASNRFL